MMDLRSAFILVDLACILCAISFGMTAITYYKLKIYLVSFVAITIGIMMAIISIIISFGVLL